MCTFHLLSVFLLPMKHLILTIAAVVAVAGLTVAEKAEAASSMFTIKHYPQVSQQGWPKWIGRLENIAYVRYQRPEFSAEYLPLSLIRTGRFNELVEEVMETPNVNTNQWPAWINDR